VKTLLVLGLFCSQTVASRSCLPEKLQKALAKKSDPVERYMLLAKAGEKQARKLLYHPGLPGSEAPLEVPWPIAGKQLTTHEIQDLLDCVWSELLENLWHWKPQSPRDREAVQQMLRRARHADEMLNERVESMRELQPSASESLPPGSRKPKSLEVVRDVEERLYALSK